MERDAPPDPLETVTLLKSDFDLLQAAANAAMEDYTNLVELLAIEPPAGVAPREVMHTIVLPAIARLMVTQGFVDASANEARTAAARFGNQTRDFGGGKQGLLVGKKDPKMFNRAQRRER